MSMKEEVISLRHEAGTLRSVSLLSIIAHAVYLVHQNIFFSMALVERCCCQV